MLVQIFWSKPSSKIVVTANLCLFPRISEETIRAFFMPPIRAVVLETFGAGNAPQLGGVIIEAYDRGVVVVAITISRNA